MVEFALSASVLVSLFLGAFRYGYTFYVYDQLQSAVRNGARYASARSYRTGTGCTLNEDTVKYMTVYGEPVSTSGNLSAGAYARVKGLDVGNVTVTYTMGASGVSPIAVEVRISNFTVDTGIGSTTFTNKPFASLPYLGAYAPGSCSSQPF
jgi:Flp pilus assembly protein TadG